MSQEIKFYMGAEIQNQPLWDDVSFVFKRDYDKLQSVHNQYIHVHEAKANFNAQHIEKLEARCKELEEMRDTWKRHFEVKDDLCKYLVTELHNAEQGIETIESENRILKAKLEKCISLFQSADANMADLYKELDSITIDSIKRGEK